MDTGETMNAAGLQPVSKRCFWVVFNLMTPQGSAFRAHNESVPPLQPALLAGHACGRAVWCRVFSRNLHLQVPGARSAGRSAYLPWHVVGGLFVYALGLLATETGILEKVTFLEMHKIAGHYDAWSSAFQRRMVLWRFSRVKIG